MEVGPTSSHSWARAVVPTLTGDRRATVLRGGATVVAYVAPGGPDDALHIAADEAVLRGVSLSLVERTSEDVASDLVAISQEADLLVVGLSSPVAGSQLLSPVTRTLAHRAHCPVMLVPLGAAVTGFDEVLCGIDLSIGSTAALKWAAREAALRGVTVLAEQVRTWAERAADAPKQSLSGWVFAQNIAEPTTILCRLTAGRSVPSVLLQTTAERRALLVIGSRRAEDGETRRGVARRVAGQVSVPVVVVPPEIPAPRKPPGT